MESEIAEDESVSTAVIRAVSAVKGRKPASLQPLSDVIDPDALDALFDSRSNDGPQTHRRLSFSYSSCHITIENSGFLTIEQVETTDRLSAQSDGANRVEQSRSDRDTEHTTTKRTPGAQICIVCQQPIDREDLQQERGELVQHKFDAEARCGISVKW